MDNEEYPPHSKMCRCADCERTWSLKKDRCQWCRRDLPGPDDCKCRPAGDESDALRLAGQLAYFQVENAALRAQAQKDAARIAVMEAAIESCKTALRTHHGMFCEDCRDGMDGFTRMCWIGRELQAFNVALSSDGSALLVALEKAGEALKPFVEHLYGRHPVSLHDLRVAEEALSLLQPFRKKEGR